MEKLFQVNSEGAGIMCDICSKLAIEGREQ